MCGLHGRELDRSVSENLQFSDMAERHAIATPPTTRARALIRDELPGEAARGVWVLSTPRLVGVVICSIVIGWGLATIAGLW